MDLASYWRGKAIEAQRRAVAAAKSVERLVLEILRLQALKDEKQAECDIECAASQRYVTAADKAAKEPKP